MDDTLLILINAFWEPLPFVLPAHKSGVRWLPMLDTREAAGRLREAGAFKGGQTYDMEARSVAVFRLEGGKGQRVNEQRVNEQRVNDERANEERAGSAGT